VTSVSSCSIDFQSEIHAVDFFVKPNDSCLMTFASREEAGRDLGLRLAERSVRPDVVLGLPRGGVVVAAEVARVLERPLGVIVVRKIGHPGHREYALGAIAEHDVLLLDEMALRESQLTRSDLDGVIAEETGRLRDYEERFHQAGGADLAGKNVVIVDDGMATGATAEAAVLSARKQMASEVMLATPVASPDAVGRLRSVADEVVVVLIEPDFMAVGNHYDYFPQIADDEVLTLLHDHA
jgi:putative phosphoribosyl transferase